MAFDARDRTTAVDIRRVGDEALEVDWKDGSTSVIELWTCLLYTSDAADDS